MLSFKLRVGKVQMDQITNRPNYRWIYCNFSYIILVFTLLSPTFHSLFFAFLNQTPFLLVSPSISSLPLLLTLSASPRLHLATLATSQHHTTPPPHPKKKKKIISLFSLTNRSSLSSLLSFREIFPVLSLSFSNSGDRLWW